MATMPKWLKKLTAAERRHLREDAGVTSLAAFKRTRKAHAEMKAKDGQEPCWTCLDIARKLGLE